jgi:hypothetical protein
MRRRRSSVRRRLRSVIRRHRRRSSMRRRRRLSMLRRHHRWFTHHHRRRSFMRHSRWSMRPLRRRSSVRRRNRPSMRHCAESPDYRRAPSRQNRGGLRRRLKTRRASGIGSDLTRRRTAALCAKLPSDCESSRLSRPHRPLRSGRPQTTIRGRARDSAPKWEHPPAAAAALRNDT